MKSLRDIAGSRRHAFLGDKTVAECVLEAEAKWKQGLGLVWAHGPNGPETGSKLSPANEAAELKLHLERSQVPARIAAILEAGPMETPGVAAVRDWMASGKTMLLLHGDPDAGKSVAAASAILQAKKTIRWHGGETTYWDSLGCVFESAADMSRIGLFGEDVRRYWDHIGKVRLLVIDDLGAELTNEAWQSSLDAVLNERYGRTECRTLITTNISCRRQGQRPSVFEERYGARIARRLREAGQVVGLEKITRAA